MDYIEKDRAKVEVLNKIDLNHGKIHTEHKTTTETIEDDAGEVTGDNRDSRFLRIKFEDGETLNLR